MAGKTKDRYRNGAPGDRDMFGRLWGSARARHRRDDYPPHDSPYPADRTRPGDGGSSRHQTPPHGYPSGASQGGPTYYGPPGSTQGSPRRSGEYPIVGEESQIPGSAPRRRGGFARTWMYWAIGGFVILALAILLVVALNEPSGFTLIVRGAPHGSIVYVDDKRVGVPTNDDLIKAVGLTAGVPRAVRVLYDGAECTLNLKTVLGVEGKVQVVDAQCQSTMLPPEIDYGGPMVLVLDEGEYLMGDNDHEADERPQHLDRIPSFYIDKFEVTNEQYRVFCGQTGRPAPIDFETFKHYYESNLKYPVIGLSWDDANAYAEWAKKRLPSEREWEKAASWNPKLKKKYQFPWGDGPEMNRANVAKDHPASITDYETDVSPYGVRGMAGNASEWVSSLFDRYRSDSPDAPGFNKGDRVVRGGSYNAKRMDLARTTFRDHYPPGMKASAVEGLTIGFRCAISVDDPRIKQFIREHSLNK